MSKKSKKHIKEFPDGSWAIYESNLQSYRSNFLSSQSIMLAVGAAVLDESKFVVLVLSAIAVFQMLYVWLPVIHYRALLVDFHKYRMDERFDCNGERKELTKNPKPLNEFTYCKNKQVRRTVNHLISVHVSEEKPFSNWRETRVKLDIIIPICMVITWLIFDLCAWGYIG